VNRCNNGGTGGTLSFRSIGATSTASAVAVPEPSSLVLTALAGALTAGFHRARARRASARR
jgi:hypothetical protein